MDHFFIQKFDFLGLQASNYSSDPFKKWAYDPEIQNLPLIH